MLQLQFLIHTLNGISSPRTVTIPFQIWSKRFKATPETSDHLSTSFFKKKNTSNPQHPTRRKPPKPRWKKNRFVVSACGFSHKFPGSSARQQLPKFLRRQFPSLRSHRTKFEEVPQLPAAALKPSQEFRETTTKRGPATLKPSKEAPGSLPQGAAIPSLLH